MHATPQTEHKHRRHIHRKTVKGFLLCFAVAIIVGLIAGLFYLLTSPNFVKPN